MQTKIIDEDLEGPEKVLETNAGAAELTSINHEFADNFTDRSQLLAWHLF